MCMSLRCQALDKVEYGKLFQLLLDRKLPALIIIMILDGYSRQRIYVQWNGVLSDPIITTNGVKQWGVLFPILFSIYMDERLKRNIRKIFNVRRNTKELADITSQNTYFIPD